MPKLTEEEKEERARIRKIASLERLAIPGERGEKLYVSKRHYERIARRVTVTNVRTITSKVVIEYQTRIGSGVLELNDLGPQQSKERF